VPDMSVDRRPWGRLAVAALLAAMLLTLVPIASSAQETGPPAGSGPAAATAAGTGIPAPDSTLLERIRAAAAAQALDAQAATAPEVRIPDYESPECPGCPRLSWGRALLGTTGINVAFNLVNLAFRPDAREEFQVTPKTWWENLKYGYIFDDNQFAVNQFGHPYQGGMYFNTGRANGLNYWESSVLAAMGSFTWECCGETNRGSINDFFSTTLGGMVLGEVFHRMAGLVRDNTATSGRTKKELMALVIDPIGGATRAINGDWGKVKPNPPDQRPEFLGVSAQAGAIWRGAAGTLDQAKAFPYLELDFVYGDPIKSEFRKPFDAFQAQFVLGGGKGFSEFNVNGRLWGTPLKDTPTSATRLNINQGYLFVSNPAYDLGGQSVGTSVVYFRSLGSRTSMLLSVSGSFLPLAAISAEHVDVNERTYDYGPAAAASVVLAVRHRDEAVLRLFYNSSYINAVNGSGADHVVHMFQGRAAWPLTRRFSAGASISTFVRNSYYAGNPDTFTRYPESRVFLGVRF
jgi:hypothetical protein